MLFPGMNNGGINLGVELHGVTFAADPIDLIGAEFATSEQRGASGQLRNIIFMPLSHWERTRKMSLKRYLACLTWLHEKYAVD